MFIIGMSVSDAYRQAKELEIAKPSKKDTTI